MSSLVACVFLKPLLTNNQHTEYLHHQAASTQTKQAKQKQNEQHQSCDRSDGPRKSEATSIAIYGLLRCLPRWRLRNHRLKQERLCLGMLPCANDRRPCSTISSTTSRAPRLSTSTGPGKCPLTAALPSSEVEIGQLMHVLDSAMRAPWRKHNWSA